MFVFGCGSPGASAEPKPTTAVPVTGDISCEGVAAHSRSLMLAVGGDEKLRVRAEQIAKIVVRRCNADGWSMELRGCLASAKTPDDTEGCEDFATEAQEDALEKETELLEGDD